MRTMTIPTPLLAEKFFDLGVRLYATPDTASAIRKAGLDVETVLDVWENDDIYRLVDNGIVDYIIYTAP